ncbi:hypothetical protein WMO40_18345, partial [Bacillaceae bacterium CLA-AA-H227]
LSNRRIPNGTYGGVRGRHGNVPPTRFDIPCRYDDLLGGEIPVIVYSESLRNRYKRRYSE